MIARHDGAIVFVAGAIPGEVVEAEVEKVQRGTVWAITREVIERSPDRVDRRAGRRVRRLGVRAHRLRAAAPAQGGDHRGCVPAHRAHHARVAAWRWSASPVDGYRMRARLHVRNGRIGFFREGTHSLCDAGADPPAARRHDRGDPPRSKSSLAGEPRQQCRRSSCRRTRRERARLSTSSSCRMPIRRGWPRSTQVDGLTGATCAPPDHPRTMELWGSPIVTDRSPARGCRVTSRSFFQGNRFLIAAARRARDVAARSRTARSISMRASACSASPRRAAGARADHRRRRRSVRRRRSEAQRRRARIVVVYEDAGRAISCRDRSRRSRRSIVDPPRTGLSKEAHGRRRRAASAPRWSMCRATSRRWRAMRG